MSGGHWEYRQYTAKDMLLDVGNDGQIIRRMPKLAQVFRDLGSYFDDVWHDLDWDLSSDALIEDDSVFEREFLEKMMSIIGKKCKFRIYEVEE